MIALLSLIFAEENATWRLSVAQIREGAKMSANRKTERTKVKKHITNPREALLGNLPSAALAAPRPRAPGDHVRHAGHVHAHEHHPDFHPWPV